MRESELEVLEQYPIEAESTRKIRGAFFINTKEGTMLLKETKISDRRALLFYTLLCQLEESGKYVDTPILNSENKLISTARDGSRYLLKKWYDGRECEVRREADVLMAAENLALLHLDMKWKEICSVEEKQEIRPPAGRHLKEEMICHNRELKKVRAFVRKRVNKGTFEAMYLKSYEKMYEIGKAVEERLANSQYDELYKSSIEEGLLIHGDYNYHNVLLLPQKVVTTNFEHFRRDVQVLDLYYFLRKVMEKHRWSVALGNEILSRYNSVRTLKKEELEYIALKIAYPEKFWKIVNAYYHSNKAWMPEKNVEKLELAVAQNQEKLRFLEVIFDFRL